MLYVLAGMHQTPPAIVQQAVTAVLMWKQTLLNLVQKAIDRQGHGGNHREDEQYRLAMAPSLRNVDDISKPANPAPFGHKFCQHDVTERQAEQQSQRIKQARHSQRYENLQNNLQPRRAERVR